MIKAYLFDFDGTLVDSMPTFVACMLRILDENNIPYEADIDTAEKVIGVLCEELMQEYPDIFKKLPTCAGVQALADSAVVLRVVAQVEEENRFGAARLINKKMKTGLEKAGMGAPYTQVVVHKSE